MVFNSVQQDTLCKSTLLCLGFCVYSQVNTDMADMAKLDWLPLTCVIIYMVAAPLGLCSIPFMYVGKLSGASGYGISI